MVALDNTFRINSVDNLCCFRDVQMKMNKELIKEKFEKLSDINKIRYDLGRIISIQFTTLLFIIVLSGVILGLILFLPFRINYGSFYESTCWVFVGFFLIIVMFILLIFEMNQIKEDKKSLEKFLMSEGKNE